ncbi:MAG: response regulator [Deltaproteobacteria bacterium]|jgi:putative two-component system response regulator|nr:response regulator [Deltaproteobacteria bacterium]
MKEILVVDDNDAVLRQIASFLSGVYDYSLVRSGSAAVSYCSRERPDLVLLDIEMPGMDGFETLRLLRLNPDFQKVPVIFLTSKHDRETEVRCLKCGARDFIRKPAEKSILLHRLDLHVAISSYQSHLSDSVALMSNILGVAVAELIECRDENTGGHVIRTSRYVELLARDLLANGRYECELNDESMEMMVRAAPLHDIGKISISDKILLKPGRLSDEEFGIMKGHAAIGASILKHMHARTPTQDYLKFASMIAASHHERFDGKGYPYGLQKEQIPLCGRIMAVADVYDALVEDRIYRPAMPHDQACKIILEGEGSQFDPGILDSFSRCHQNFAVIVKSHKESRARARAEADAATAALAAACAAAAEPGVL